MDNPTLIVKKKHNLRNGIILGSIFSIIIFSVNSPHKNMHQNQPQNIPAMNSDEEHLQELRSHIESNQYNQHELAQMYSEWCQTRECEGTTYQDMLDDLELKNDLAKIRGSTR